MPEVKWVKDRDELHKGATFANIAYPEEAVPVIPLADLTKWLKEEFRCDCGRGLFGEPHLVWCKHRIYDRLLTQLEAHRKEG